MVMSIPYQNLPVVLTNVKTTTVFVKRRGWLGKQTSLVTNDSIGLALIESQIGKIQSFQFTLINFFSNQQTEKLMAHSGIVFAVCNQMKLCLKKILTKWLTGKEHLMIKIMNSFST